MNLYRIAGFLSLGLICFTFSCKTSRHIIRITESDATSQKLLLKNKDGSPADTIKVRELDKVLWRIKTKTVRAIAKIDDKSDIIQPKFLTDRKPHKKFLSRAWVTKINSVSKEEFKGKDYVEENYFITWKPRGSESTKTYDPLIMIYPR
jgi:hypothetical protein